MSFADFWLDKEKAHQKAERLKKIKAELAPWQKLEKELAEISDLLELAQTEKDESISAELKRRLASAGQKIRQLELLRKFTGKYDGLGALVSIYAGAGGVDAQDWVAILLRMYLRYFASQGWAVRILDKSVGGEAGLKNVTLEVRGPYAYGVLKSEKGVHRLVRISPFDANKRRHTSFASVDVIPEIEEKELNIDDKYVLRGIKRVVEGDEKAETKLKALFKLSDILDLEDKTQTKVTQLSGTVFQGFADNILEEVQRPKEIGENNG